MTTTTQTIGAAASIIGVLAVLMGLQLTLMKGMLRASEERLGGRIDTAESRLGGRIDVLDQRMDGLDRRMDGLDRRMDRLETDVRAIRDDVYVPVTRPPRRAQPGT